VLSQVFNICKKKIFRWYKEVLSGFTTEEIQKEIREFDTIDNSVIDPYTNKPETVLVPICKPENFGKNMCIDDKNLGDNGFTIISNQDTGKIACMIQSRKAKIINDVLHQHVPVSVLAQVEVLTKDLARSYELVRKESFIRATGVADKFHVIKLGIQAMSDLRVKYRQEELTKERKRKDAHNSLEAERREQAKQQGIRYKSQKYPPAKRLENGETILQLLAATNKALSQFQKKWGKNMKRRIKILFRLFPDLQKIYHSISAFRGIYDVKNFGNEVLSTSKKSLEKWIQKAGSLEISELQNFVHTVNEHKGNILAYFRTGKTNAFAESLNSKLQRFLRDNFGIRNIDFFLWRINKIFS
jgi:transposase